MTGRREPQVYADARRFRAELLRGNAAALREMAVAMRDLIRTLDVQIMGLAERLSEVALAGGRVTPGQVLQLAEWQSLRSQAERALRDYAIDSADLAALEQRRAIGAALRQTRMLVAGALPAGLDFDALARLGIQWVALDARAFEHLVGRLRDGSALRSYLEARVVPGTIEGMARTLTTGLVDNPRETARRMRQAFAGGAVQALAVARTETLRAYRDASRSMYAENRQVVRAYRRMASLDDRTCGACWLLDGTLFMVEQDLEEHVSGRCFLVPETVSWRELGLEGPDPEPPPAAGREQFVRLPDARQRQILGNDRLFNLWKSGQVGIGDLVHRSDHPAFGTSWTTSSARGARLSPGRALPPLDRTGRHPDAGR